MSLQVFRKVKQSSGTDSSLIPLSFTRTDTLSLKSCPRCQWLRESTVAVRLSPAMWPMVRVIIISNGTGEPDWLPSQPVVFSICCSMAEKIWILCPPINHHRLDAGFLTLIKTWCSCVDGRQIGWWLLFSPAILLALLLGCLRRYSLLWLRFWRHCSNLSEKKRRSEVLAALPKIAEW